MDDTVARTEGEPTQVAKDLTAVGTILCDGMTKAELEVSPKTTVVASSAAIALGIHVDLKAEGYPIKVANASMDLGIGTVAARRRVAAKAKKRAQ